MNTETIIFLILGLIIAYIIYIYNQFIQLINRTNEAWSDISVQLKRRYDLIPNLVDIVKGYAKHEKQVLEDVTEARVQAMTSKTIHDKETAEDHISTAIGKLLAVAENYPQLRASENFAKLQDELTETENIIASARRFYNGNVRELNTKIEVFPSNILAKIFTFQKREFFQLGQEAVKKPVEVKI